MTPAEAMGGFDALWRELKVAAKAAELHTRGISPSFSARSRTEVIADLIRHCEAAFALYEGRDAYRAAMWMRRAYLLRRGETARIYDGTDAWGWRRAHEAGTTLPRIAV